MNKKPKEKFKILKLIFQYLLLGLILTSLILIINYRKKTSNVAIYTPPIKTVVIEKPKLGTIEKSITFPTYIEASQYIPIISFIQGKILKYNIKVGDYVYKNQIIAIIDSTTLDQQVLQAQAAYDAYKKTYDRIEALYKNKATSAQNFDEIKSKMDGAKAQLEIIKVQREYCNVKSTISGTVIAADLAIGNIATSQTPIAIISNLDSQIVNIAVPEKYYDIFLNNKNNLEIEIKKDQSNLKTMATFISIDPYIQPQAKVFILKAKLQDNLTYFRPGMYCLTKITYKKINDVFILNQGIKKLDGSLYYYNEKDESANYLDKKYIINEDQNNEYFRIDEAYSDVYFIIEGQNTVFDGQKVNVIIKKRE